MKAAIAAAFLIAAGGAALAGPGEKGHSHEAGFSAGEPGDPKKPARIIQVTMNEGDEIGRAHV